MILSAYLKQLVINMRQAQKFIEQDKGKHILGSNLEHKAPQGPKKGVYARMIAGRPIVVGESRRALRVVASRQYLPQSLARKSISLAITNLRCSAIQSNYIHRARC